VAVTPSSHDRCALQASRHLDCYGVAALVAPHDIYVYGPLFTVFRGDGYCLRLATPAVNKGRREAGCDLTDRAVGISI
jgi:hypothetical protein